MTSQLTFFPGLISHLFLHIVILCGSEKNGKFFHRIGWNNCHKKRIINENLEHDKN